METLFETNLYRKNESGEGMIGVSGTVIGSIVAEAWFIADYGTMGVNYLLGNGATGLGDMIDEAVAENYGKFELYDGLY